MASGPRFLADENLNNDLLRALLRRLPDLDIIRVQDTAIAGTDDPALLAWAADEGRILLTHDARTIPGFAYARLRAALVLAVYSVRRTLWHSRYESARICLWMN